MSRRLNTVAVIIPARNEAAAIGAVLRGIPERIGGMQALPIVIDDGSTDATAQVARNEGARVLRHTINLGVGSATITGLRAAQMLDADVIVTMDADGQHDPAEIERLVFCLVSEDLDVVIGSRIIQPQGMPISRFLANLLLSAFTFISYGKMVSDSQSGFKVISRAAAQKLNLQSSGYEICSEIVGEIYRNRLRYRSVPIKAVYTTYSQGKGQHFLNGINLILGLLVRWVRRT